MITFFICLAILILGFLFYGKALDRTFGPDDRKTPAETVNDGVDYTPMSEWKVTMIQLLNIAGLGPIIGAINGALFGPVVYIWIVLGTVFAGGVHDYMSGMISMRNNGASITELTGNYLGNRIKNLMRVFAVLLLIMVGVVFSKGPANLLAMLTPEKFSQNFWFWLIIIYYFIATFISIDKVIGKLYPIFGFCLIFMALGVAFSFVFSGKYQMPELWNNFGNYHPQNIPIWPFMFITVACGAISGFHSTQSPMMARCCKSERQGHHIFYGAMVIEGIIALIWAMAGCSFYESSQELLAAGAGINSVVYTICTTTMGKIGGAIALIGVIVCPVTSGDTAYRSARLIIADWFKFDQKNWKNRLILTSVILGTGTLITQLNYQTIWRYCAWANQALAVFPLWVGAIFLKKNNKNPYFCIIPAMFMTAVTFSYLISAPECLGAFTSLILGNYTYRVSNILGILLAGITFVIFKGVRCRPEDKG